MSDVDFTKLMRLDRSKPVDTVFPPENGAHYFQELAARETVRPQLLALKAMMALIETQEVCERVAA